MIDATHESPAEHEDGPWSRLGRFLRRIPRQPRARSVVSAILEAADETLDVTESGSLQTLFARAGVAPGSFYEYFASRESLLAAVVERVTQRNFARLLASIDEIFREDAPLETLVRRSARVTTAQYLERPTHLRAVIGIAHRLGLLGPIAQERDRFARTLAQRLGSHLPMLSVEEREDTLRAMADLLTGIVVVSLYRVPAPSTVEVADAVAQASWALLRLRMERAGGSDEAHDPLSGEGRRPS